MAGMAMLAHWSAFLSGLTNDTTSQYYWVENVQDITELGTLFFDALRRLTDDAKRKKKVVELRQKRKQHIEIMGGPPLHTEVAFEPALDMCLKEAAARGLEYDLCVVPQSTYKDLYDIPAGIPISPDGIPDDHRYMIPDQDIAMMKEKQPPQRYTTDGASIDITYSHACDRAFLIDSRYFCSEVEL